MKVLVVGGGGREHALAWKLKESPQVGKVYIAPGNAGTALEGENVAIAPYDLDGLRDFAAKERIDLTVVGPELPLTLGIADRFQEAGLSVFGPTAEGARLEGSKSFAKDLMVRSGIPTASYRCFEDAKEALLYINEVEMPVVVKADGLAAGKGVIICRDRQEAAQAVSTIMEDRAFGEAGKRVVVEELWDPLESTCRHASLSIL
jgi:Phosphoribosylamine-glycine ligase